MKQSKAILPVLFSFALILIFTSSLQAAVKNIKTPKASPATKPISISVVSASYSGADTCKGCHEDRFASYSRTFHSNKINPNTPASKHECETCHGSGVEHVLAGGGKGVGGIIPLGDTAKPEKINETCLSCHEQQGKLFWKTGVHANQKLSCVSCHNVHPSEKDKNNKRQLKKPTETETCFMCHKDKQAMMQRSSHMPIREGKISCASCHDPHGSGNPRNLKAISVNELCYQCHAEKKGPFLWEHPPARDNCLNCHDPHGSLQNKILIARAPNVLCQRCHVGTSHPSTEWDYFQVTMEAVRPINRACLNCHPNMHGSNSPSGKRFFR